MVWIDFKNVIGKIKPMNAVNNGPSKAVAEQSDQIKSNFLAYKNARIPFARNHDAAYCPRYGGEHTVDVLAVFPDFDADPNDENNYDFFYTDEYVKNCFAAGTETFYRLGHKIENMGLKKYGAIPPKDFLKWTKICEHIILHYNFGWANGFHYNLRYWEIWNEPDLRAETDPDHPTWRGTKREFFVFFETAASYLKEKFPALKIGGPALAGNLDWAEDFLRYMQEKSVALDFFSWHIYTGQPQDVIKKANAVRALLDKYGYTKTESILNEWNYVIDFNKNFVKSIESIIGVKGAAFSASVMNLAQNSSIDMLMYYDARLNTAFNGMFDFYTYRPLKGYYPFYMWGVLNELSESVFCKSTNERVSVTAAMKGQSAAAMISFLGDGDAREEETEITMKGLSIEKGEVYLLDETHTFEKTQDFSGNVLRLKLKPDSVVFLTINDTELTET